MKTHFKPAIDKSMDKRKIVEIFRKLGLPTSRHSPYLHPAGGPPPDASGVRLVARLSDSSKLDF